MAISFTCPRCDRKYSVADSLAGRRLKCKACGQEFGVPPRSQPEIFDEEEDVVEAPSSAPLPPPRRVAVPHPDDIPPTRPVAKPSKKQRQKSKLFGSLMTGLSFVGGSLGVIVVAAMIAVFANSPPLLGMVLIVIGGMWLLWGVGAGLEATSHWDYSLTRSVGLRLPIIGPLVSLVIWAMRWAMNPLSLGAMFFGVLMLVGGIGLTQTQGDPEGKARSQGGEVFAVNPNALDPAQPATLPEMSNEEPVWQFADGVVIEANNLAEEADRQYFLEKLDALARRNLAGDRVEVTIGGLPIGGFARFQVEPVADPDQFAKNMASFAKVHKMVGRKIQATANFPSDQLLLRRVEFTKNKIERDLADGDRRNREDLKRLNDRLGGQNSQQPNEQGLAKTVELFHPNADPRASKIDAALAALKSNDPLQTRAVLLRLRIGVPEDRKAEVAAAIVPVLATPDDGVVEEALRLLGSLKSPDSIPAILAVLDRQRVSKEAVLALGRIADPRAATLLADRLEINWPDAKDALIAIGPAAESAVLPKLKDGDPKVRSQALEVLEMIGGAESIKTMKTMRPDSDLGVRGRAAETYQKILQRVKGK